MKKNAVLLLTSVSALCIGVAVAGLVLRNEPAFLRGDLSYSMTLDSTSEVTSLDEGNIQQISIKNNKFDMIGYTAVSGKLGSIKKANYGSYQYNGMIYNRSVINGFKSLTVNFSGGTLSYLFTDFLMEDMDFDGVALTSGVAVNPAGKPYFLIYNESTTPVTIDSIELEYDCDASVDAGMIFNKNSTKGGARSYAKRSVFEDSFVTLENNPTKTTNNYSLGQTGDHTHPDAWYRWNGRYFADSDALGTEFSIGMTVIGNISYMIDESKYFHYAVWPQMGWYDDGHYGEAEHLHSTANNYVQTYIGNDNYEPLGKDHALHPSDPYVQESYTGRFFSDYGYYDSTWKFPDPDTTTISDGVTTFREAYEAYDMPYWFIRFDFYLDEENDPKCDVFINGYRLFSQWIFEDYDKVNTPDLVVHTMPMHCVNYGADAEGNPADSYEGSFTYPRLIA